jgi:anaerobic selenocysteine-containing dehydrogenase
MVIRQDPCQIPLVEGLKNLSFSVVHELFMIVAGEIADIILPTSSYLESIQVITYPFNASPSVNMQLVGLRDKVVDPPGECHSDFEFLFELAYEQENDLKPNAARWMRIHTVGPKMVNGKFRMDYVPLISRDCQFPSYGEKPSCMVHCPTKAMKVRSPVSMLDALGSGL